jgi:hypothetical protein
MFYRPFLLPVAALVLLSLNAFGDTITLKSGEKIEGKILSDTPAEITIEVKTGGITDETKVPKAQVAKVDKEQPDEGAWQSVKNLKLGPNSLPQDQYDRVMRPLQSFLTEYPNSSHLAEVKKTLTAFEEEKKRVDAGEVRLGEKWLSKEEAGVERYQINGQLLFQYMRSQATARDPIGALNTFAQLEKNFPGSRSYPDGVELARALLTELQTAVNRAKQNYPLLQAEFERGVEAASETQKPELLAARQREIAQGEAAVAAAERAGLMWSPLVPRSEKSIDALASKIPTELSRLAAIEVPKLRQSLQLTDQVRKHLADKKATEAEEALTKATELWSENEIATRLQPQVASLKSTASATETAAVETPAETTDVATTTDDSTAVTDEPQEDETPFFMTPGGIITGLVILAVVIAAVIVFRKIKGRASEVLE